MKIEKRGTAHDENPCPSTDVSPSNAKCKKPLYKKWWFWVLIVLAVAAIGSAVGGSKDPSTDPVSVPSAPSASSGVVAESSSPTDDSSIAEPVDSAYHAGDVINANGLKIAYISSEKWDEYDTFNQPSEGYMYVRILLEAENTASTDRYISSFDFECYADGKKQSQAFLAVNNVLQGGNLSTGRKDEGYVYFQVPADAEDIEVEYETNFWSDAKVILKIDL